MQSKQIVDNAISESVSGLLSHYRAEATVICLGETKHMLVQYPTAKLLELVMSRLNGLRDDESIIFDDPSIDDLCKWLSANNIYRVNEKSFQFEIIIPPVRKAHAR